MPSGEEPPVEGEVEEEISTSKSTSNPRLLALVNDFRTDTPLFAEVTPDEVLVLVQ